MHEATSNTPVKVSVPQLPLVSVVIPTYNRLPFITEAIESVIQQTYTNWELIIADDGSTDGSPAIIKNITDPRIRMIELPHNGNIAMLRNTASHAGKGSLIAFLDSDDCWTPRKLELQVKSLSASGKRWGYGRFELMNEKAETIPVRSGGFHPYAGWILDRIITAEAAVSIGTLIVERSLFDEAGGFNTDTELIYREDYELALKLALKAEADVVDELLVRIREHNGRSTNAVTDSHERTAYVYSRFIKDNPGNEFVEAARKRQSFHLAEAAGKDIMEKKYLQAGRSLSKAIAAGDRFAHVLRVLRNSIKDKPGKI